MTADDIVILLAVVLIAPSVGILGYAAGQLLRQLKRGAR